MTACSKCKKDFTRMAEPVTVAPNEHLCLECFRDYRDVKLGKKGK